MLCGKTQCPVLIRAKTFSRTMPMTDGLEIDGTCPPSVFVGRIGYPYVNVGPLVPPIHADTSLFDMPEEWLGRTIDEIVSFRSMMIRGKHRVHVNEFQESGKIMDSTLELALASRSTDVELMLRKKPTGFLFLDDGVQPFGPSAPLQNLKINNTKWDQRLEKAYYDSDLKACPAVIDLYRDGVLVTRIQRALSAGAFGIEENRRLVPTRWSITAVDSMISKRMMRAIRTYPLINEYRLYESSYLDNQFEILMIPDAWSYEAIEAWFPGSTWNPIGSNIVLYGDWEDRQDRTTYAKIGGCYYAARLAVCELLEKERRQATVIVLREARPGYVMPLGVWQVRENVRNAMLQRPHKYLTLDEAMERISTQFQIPLNHWMKVSHLISNARKQTKLALYF
ncbi:MAG: hypothetical protein JSV35_06730 [Candidatus Bathyarchaeota archaeon]|nr:MAG: hypothetical protein JSV35_06730 [Candidatus Bathyarchaeota archaeon]